MMPPRRVSIRVDHITVDGVAIRPHDAPIVRAALESELARLLTAEAPAAGGLLRAASTTSRDIGPASSAASIGQGIARSLHTIIVGGR